MLAKQLRIPLHVIRSETPLYLAKGKEVPEDVDHQVEKQFNQLLDDCNLWREEVPVADRIRLSTALETFREGRCALRSDV